MLLFDVRFFLTSFSKYLLWIGKNSNWLASTGI